VWVYKELVRGAVRENPSFVLVLGNCPTLAVTVAVVSGFWMAVAAGGVLIASNVVISALRHFIPREVRIPCFVVIIASLVTITEMLMKAYLPDAINRTLGIFIPLIVVNCIIFGRAEAYAYANDVAHSFVDGLGVGLGYLAALLLVSGIREALGAGSLLGMPLWSRYPAAYVMTAAPGAFLVIGILIGAFRAVAAWRARRDTALPGRPVTSREMSAAPEAA
jgi:Na+-translocating ferredoxin:NAD+ oxidoreductase subunit E